MSRWRELNPWPLPYQGSALPLSYNGFEDCGFNLERWSGRRGSNSRHLAWKANALPTELLPHGTVVDWVSIFGEFRGEWWIRTTEVVRQQIYSLSHLATLVTPLISCCVGHMLKWSRWRDSNPRPADYKSAALASWATPAVKSGISKNFRRGYSSPVNFNRGANVVRFSIAARLRVNFFLRYQHYFIKIKA